MGKHSEQSFSEAEDDSNSSYNLEKKKSHKKASRPKDKQIKKQEKSNPKASSKKQQNHHKADIKDTPAILENANPSQQHNLESIYNDQQSLQLSVLEDHYNPNNSHPNQASNSQEIRKKNFESFQMTDDLEDLRMIFVDFFNLIQQPNGLVFKKQFRIKLNKEWGSKIKFTEEHQLDPEGEEQNKIHPEVMDINLFKKAYHKVKMDDKQFSNYIQEDVQDMKQLFTETSYIFCQEVTSELYKVLKTLCNIALEFKDEDIAKLKDESKMIKKFRQFGDKIASQTDKAHQYFFFGFQFVKLPDGKSEQEIDNLKKKERFKFALHPKFRKPGSEFAMLAQKAGIHLFERMTELDCFKTLI